MGNGPLGVVRWNRTAVRMYSLVEGAIRELFAESVYGKSTVGTMEPDDYD